MSLIPPVEISLVRLSGPPISTMEAAFSVAHFFHAATPSACLFWRSGSGTASHRAIALGDPVKTARYLFIVTSFGLQRPQSTAVARSAASPGLVVPLAQLR